MAASFLVAQQREPAAIGRQLHRTRARPIEAGAGEDLLEGERGGRGHRRTLRGERRGKAEGRGGKQDGQTHGNLGNLSIFREGVPRNPPGRAQRKRATPCEVAPTEKGDPSRGRPFACSV
ncbi:hypothetical protein [Leptolyngbya sp. 7M]|uniref:hypothetical protein n=1 Tax=Leptolyngbya sp. 7M TaxID=2812896 RepID=UPI001B8BF113|nr:hypothetical protein [Leptolyngbya sp. 7M]QYO64989.1 hypothetical protein JVX88_36615 [Leptolyngbya sp. 7M]